MRQQLVLIADDNPDSRLIFRTILETRGYAVIEATNGAEAIELARRHRPDLVLMDLMMPATTGWEAADILRHDPELSTIPVVAITAATPPREAVRSAGFCALLPKPIAPLDVVRAVEVCLNAHHRGERWVSDIALQIGG